MNYEEFKTAVRDATGAGDPGASRLFPIPALRRRFAEQVSREEFDSFVLRLHEEGFVHLLSHVDAGRLSPEERADCLRHPSGMLVYWLYWL